VLTSASRTFKWNVEIMIDCLLELRVSRHLPHIALGISLVAGRWHQLVWFLSFDA